MRSGGRAPRMVAVIAVAALATLVVGELWMSALALALWLGTLAWADRAALRRIARPGFWATTTAVALSCGFLLGTRDMEFGGVALSSSGLAAGAAMVVRAAFIFALSSWAGRAIDFAALERISRRVGLAGLGGAVGTAFELLPALTERVQLPARGTGPGRWQAWPGALQALGVELVVQTARTAESMVDGTRSKAP